MEGEEQAAPAAARQGVLSPPPTPPQQPHQHQKPGSACPCDGHTHPHSPPQPSSQPPSQPPQPPLQPFRLLYPVGSRKWNCRAAPHKRAPLLGAYQDGQTVLARPLQAGGATWLAVGLAGGAAGFCKQHDEVHMLQHHNTRTGYGWYRVVYCSLYDDSAFGISLETLTPELLTQLAAAPPRLPPAAAASSAAQSPPAAATPGKAATAAAAAAAGGSSSSSTSPDGSSAASGCRRDRCAACRQPLRTGSLAYIGSCGHSYHFDCLRQFGDANICTACGVWYAVGQSPPEECPPPAPTSVFQHVHQHLWFVPPFYRYILIYGCMLLLSPFVILASWLGLI